MPKEKTKKNTAKSSFKETKIAAGFFLLSYENEAHAPVTLERFIDTSFLQFHFCVKGSCSFLFNAGSYVLPLPEDYSLLLYNPQRNLPIHLEVAANSALVSLVISIEKFHALFSPDANYVSFLNAENKDKKYYKEKAISPSMVLVVNQILNYKGNETIKNLYFNGKALELLSLYFNTNAANTIEQCPFLADETNVAKIKRAKDIVIARMDEPPSLPELAEEIGLSLKKLKEGFKQLYGTSVFSFLLDYKLEIARNLLESGAYNVNEVGLKIGYSTASHFIAAFKKKYGTTPKKYLLSLA